MKFYKRPASRADYGLMVGMGKGLWSFVQNVEGLQETAEDGGLMSAVTDMSLGQHGLSPGPSSPPQTHLHDPGSNPGIHGGGVVHVGSLADKLRLAASKGQTDKVQDLLQAGATFSSTEMYRIVVSSTASVLNDNSLTSS
ncbi:hypothetical protein BaRGS_00014179, partial [Batillaria attramentaria]